MTDVRLVKIYKQLHLSALLTIVFLASSWAVLRSDFFIFHDYTQGARIVEMSRAFQDGHFPPIWSENLGFGYGMPLFEFYAPLPYYITGAFYTLGLSLASSVKLLFLIPAIITLVGGFLLGRKLYGSLGGLIVSSALVLAPYRAVNLFVRGALSEIWGLAMLPLILLGGIQVIKNEKNGWILLVASITGLLLSHNLTALMFLPFSVLFLGSYLFYFAKYKDWNLKQILCKILHFAGYYFLSFVLSAYYTIPALLEKDFTRLDATILADYFDYNNHFLFIRQFFQDNWAYGGSTYGPMDDISFYLGFGQLVALLILFYLLLNSFFQFYSREKNIFKSLKNFGSRFWTAVVSSGALFLFALLLTTQKTQFIWDSIAFLEFLQFPWRFLNVAIVFLSILIGGVVVVTRNKVKRYIFTIVILTLLIFNYQYFQPEEFVSIQEAQEYYYSDVEKLRNKMSTTLPDYIPIGIQEEVPELVPQEGQFFVCEMTESCEFEYSVVSDRVHKKEFDIHSDAEQLLVLTTAEYPGWIVRHGEEAISKSPSQNGLLTSIIPPGKTKLTVQLQNSEVRSYSQLLTFFGLVAFGILLHFQKKTKKDVED